MADTPPPPDRAAPAAGDDDPTHALDDFLRRMRPIGERAAPPDLDDLSDLVARLQPERAPARPRGGRLRNGQAWSADDVQDVPEVEVRVPRASAAAAAPSLDLPRPGPAPVGDWQPDLQALQLRPAADPRLLAQWQPGAWIGAVRQVLDSSTAFAQGPAGPTVETYAPHRLLLLWPPAAAPLPGRWPQRVRLAAVARERAAALLLQDLPDDARLWLHPGGDAIDWALAAEIALLHEPALHPFQIDGLRAFIAAEREAGFAALNRAYARDPASGAVRRLAD